MMHALGSLLEKHRNTCLILLMAAAFVVGLAQEQPATQAAVSIPVSASVTPALNKLDAYRRERDQARAADLAVLERLADNPEADAQIRDAASAQLHVLIAARELQAAVEGALLNSSLSPCVAIVTDGSLTIVTGKSAPTERDMALVLEIARVHAGIAPENVRLITSD